MLGVMIDCSRNAVMTCAAVKDYVDLLAQMGYDTLMLYTEDTYEVKEEPYFGYMRGKYTKAELKEIDAYCTKKGIELIPCIQTLAHVNGIFQASSTYSDIRDCDDILLIDDDRTYLLLEHIFQTISECFTSKKIHIGMDEATKTGYGKYLNKHGYVNQFDLLVKHLNKVCEMASAYGFEPMIWHDMFWNADGDVSKLPDNLSLVYWNYYNDDSKKYIEDLSKCHSFGRKVVFAGGAWTWKGFMPDNAMSIANTKAAIEGCQKTGTTDILMTLWGDDGAECSRYALLPTLLYTAEMMKGNSSLEDIKSKFFALTGMSWDPFMLLDKLDTLSGEHLFNPSKYLLYNDPFMGLHDGRVDASEDLYYSDLLKELNSLETTPKYAPLFETAKALCKVLSVKTELGVKTRKAYNDGNKELLKQLAQEDYRKAITYLEEFYNIFAKQWDLENKPFGFDIQDIRIGGLIWRLKQCRQRILEYCCGNIDTIPELEEIILENTGKVAWGSIATPNVVSHVFYG